MEQKYVRRAKEARLVYKQAVRGSIESPDQSSVALAGGIGRPLVSLPPDRNKTWNVVQVRRYYTGPGKVVKT